MRKGLRKIVEKDFHEALTTLGYVKLKQDGSEWRRQQFHFFIRKKGKEVVLHIHEDLPKSFPPFHRARHKGKQVEKELSKIVEAYKRRRATK